MLEEQELLAAFLRGRKVNFAWTYDDMPGLDPDIVVHHLAIYPKAKHIRQKLRKMHPQIALLVKMELKKILDVGFIWLIDYLEWSQTLYPFQSLMGEFVSA